MWETIKSVLDYLGYPSEVILLITIAVGVYFWIRGIGPVLIRLGNGLARRKIAIFAKGDSLTGLENLLHDSKLFNGTNIRKITSSGDVGMAESSSIFLVYWPDWKEDIDKILQAKRDNVPLIIYAPQEHGFIPKETIAELEKRRNVVLSNFRGRLLNDIVSSMITTSYDKGE